MFAGGVEIVPPAKRRSRTLDVVSVCLAIFAPLLVAAAYQKWLGYRSDYLGHYLAGAGGTFALLAVVLSLLPRPALEKFAPWAILLATLLAIGLGVITESTIFRLAKFDEVDFFNQSLGAVLAGLGVLAAYRPSRRWGVVGVCIIAGIFALISGFYYAFR